MNIKTGDYVLRSDSMQMWIERVTVNANGGTTVTKVAGYSPDFKTLCESFCRHKYRASGAEDMRQLLDDLKTAEEETIQLIHSYFQDDGKNTSDEDDEDTWGDDEL